MSGLLPWDTNETPQKRGRRVEKDRAKEYGARLHPGSGASYIKHDASNSEDLIEFKEVQRSHTLNGEYCRDLFNRAVRQEKSALYVVNFNDVGITAEIRLRKAKHVR